MALLTLIVSFIHACIAAFNFRNGFFLYVFLYATYPRLFSLGIGNEGFALSAQRLTMISMLLLFVMRFLYGSPDVKQSFRTAFSSWRTMLCLVAILGARLFGNYATGRIDTTVLASFVDETLTILFVVFLCLTCLKTKKDVYALLFIIAASLIPNQIAVIVETITQQSIYPASLDVDFETSRSMETMLGGSERFGLYRVMGTFDSSLQLMEVTTIIFPIAIYFAMFADSQNKRKAMSIVALLAPATIFLTGSRTGVILLALTVIFYVYRLTLKRFGRTEGILLLLVFTTAVGIFLYFNLESMAQQFLFTGGAGYSTASRIFQYVFSWPLILQSPYYGYGFARNIVDVIPLNQLDGYYLRMTLEGGLIALLSLMALQFVTWRRLRSLENHTKIRDDRELAIALQTSVGLIAVMMLALNMSVSSFYCYLLAGIAIQMVSLTTVGARKRV